jgi:hypothetical protein
VEESVTLPFVLGESVPLIVESAMDSAPCLPGRTGIQSAPVD